MYDIIIVGAGPAGLTAAIYGSRAGKNVLVLEASSYGGQIINTPDVQNYPGIKSISGFDFATTLYEQATGFGAEIKFEKVTEIKDLNSHKVVITSSGEYEGKTVILATGAKNRPLSLDRENELIGRGVSYCATCDGAFFKGKDVAVAGGGNTALEDALFLSDYCNKVYLIHRRDTFRGEDHLQSAVKARDNIILILDSNIVSIVGNENVEGITVKNAKDGSEKEIKVSGLFIAIGQMPDNEAFKYIIDLDDKGYINAGEDCKTKVPGVFTAGDCRTKEVRQLASAASDGAVSALAACAYINENAI